MKKFKVTEGQFKSVIKHMIKEDIQGQVSDYIYEEEETEEVDNVEEQLDIEEGLGDMDGGNGGHYDKGIGEYPSNLDQDKTDLMEQVNKMKKIINY